MQGLKRGFDLGGVADFKLDVEGSAGHLVSAVQRSVADDGGVHAASRRGSGS